MKKLHCLFFLSMFFFSQYSYTSDLSISPQTFIKGQIIAQNYLLYRKIIDITPEGYYVQNFYKNNHAKQSNIFLIRNPTQLLHFTTLHFDKLSHTAFEGELTLWSDGGNKTFYTTFLNGNAEGALTTYYPNKQIELEGNYRQGKPDGLWLFYRESGELEKKIYYKTGIVQWEQFILKLP